MLIIWHNYCMYEFVIINIGFKNMNDIICALYGALPYIIFMIVYIATIYMVFDYFYFRK
jgi:uncharacterized membrane protein YuzA (DUF378 family)